MGMIKKYPNDFDLGQALTKLNPIDLNSSGVIIEKLIKQFPNFTELGSEYRKMIINLSK
jgi:hypothetical protein|tara:strand:- start:875 stop:1051 length:177 start_codon:yes stop_codon:yes gene_type:complete